MPRYDTLGWIPVIHRTVYCLHAGHVEVNGGAAIVECDSPIFNHTIIYHTNDPLSRAGDAIVVTLLA